LPWVEVSAPAEMRARRVVGGATVWSRVASAGLTSPQDAARSTRAQYRAAALGVARSVEGSGGESMECVFKGLGWDFI
jgi:hypothetical protein